MATRIQELETTLKELREVLKLREAEISYLLGQLTKSQIKEFTEWQETL